MLSAFTIIHVKDGDWKVGQSGFVFEITVSRLSFVLPVNVMPN